MFRVILWIFAFYTTWLYFTYNVMTFWFRWEALASISSVSELKIISVHNQILLSFSLMEVTPLLWARNIQEVYTPEFQLAFNALFQRKQLFLLEDFLLIRHFRLSSLRLSTHNHFRTMAMLWRWILGSMLAYCFKLFSE